MNPVISSFQKILIGRKERERGEKQRGWEREKKREREYVCV